MLWILDTLCVKLRLDPKHMRWAIDQSGRCNNKFHGHLDSLVSRCTWTELVTDLRHDIVEANNVTESTAEAK